MIEYLMTVAAFVFLGGVVGIAAYGIQTVEEPRLFKFWLWLMWGSWTLGAGTFAFHVAQKAVG